MAIREHAEGKRDLLLIDPRKLNVDPEYNVRKLDAPEAREGLDELKALIRASGVQEALRVREDTDGRLIIVRGHRRHKVVMELINDEDHDIKLIPVTQEPRGTTPADRNWDLIDSNSAAPLPLVERAEVLYRQIHTFGWTEDEILRRTGKTRTWLNQQLDLRAMPEAVKEHVGKGHISATLAKQISKNVDPDEAAKLIQENLDENKKIVGSKKRRTKVTRKTLERDKPKPAEPPKSDPPKPEPELAGTTAQTVLVDELHETTATTQPPIMAPNAEVEIAPQPTSFTPLSDETPPHPEPMFRDADERPHEPHPQLQTAAAREFPAAAFEKPRDGVEGLLLKFLNADVFTLATMHAQLVKEHQEAAAQDGATDAQYQLCVAADVIGDLRFPDGWQQAKANSELAEVA